LTYKQFTLNHQELSFGFKNIFFHGHPIGQVYGSDTQFVSTLDMLETIVDE
jgi:hypothetical protein